MNMEIYVHAWEVSQLIYVYLEMTGTTDLMHKVTDPDVFLHMANTSPLHVYRYRDAWFLVMFCMPST